MVSQSSQEISLTIILFFCTSRQKHPKLQIEVEASPSSIRERLSVLSISFKILLAPDSNISVQRCGSHAKDTS